MKLDLNCVRDVLLAVEELDFNETTNPTRLCTALPGYTEEQITYTCLKLEEGSFLTLEKTDAMGSYLPGIKCVICLTYQGHEFLEKIRPKGAWHKISGVLNEIGSTSLELAGKVSSAVLTELAKDALGHIPH